MNCDKTMELLSEYIDGILDAETEKQIEHHISICSTCKQEYQLLKDLIDDCHQIDEVDLPDDFHQKLHNRLIQDSDSTGSGKTGISYRRYYKAAAALILAISMGIIMNSGILNMGSQKKSESTQRSSEMAKEEAKIEDTQAEAPQYGIMNDRKAALTSEAKPKAAVDKNIVAAQSVKAYNVMTVNLREDEYKKYFQDIGVIIEGLGGYLKSKEPVIYILPDKSMDTLINRLRDEYKISSISITTRDITVQFTEDVGEASGTAENGKQPQLADGSGKDMDKQAADKSDELKEMDSILGNVVIEINRN